MQASELSNADLGAAVLVDEWMITIDTPAAGVDTVLAGLEADLQLMQGPYDCCSYIHGEGTQRFRCLEGSHAGAEGTIQQTHAAQIVISIPRERSVLEQLFKSVFKHHVNEEPTIRVLEVLGSRSKLLPDKDNPNRYWNRADASELHGTPTEKRP